MIEKACVHRRSPSRPTESRLVTRALTIHDSALHFALAFVDGEVSGLASVAIAHPGIDLERLLFLKDLFVRDNIRNASVGGALIGFLADHCLSHGIGRIDLTSEDWNEGALRFYARLGAERHGQKVFLRISGDALKAVKP
ncbi:GNAT family N-acetyltransferase [Mesorhizobium sp. M0830]|uniref:GNAT family N-acetyltransferase n=1 Tax=Mesorhizobium sp. M0830 TaxID=2957008 RepID=UPI003337E2F1